MVFSWCAVMKETTVYRVAISQFVILLGCSVVLFCLGAFTLDDLELEDDERERLKKGFYAFGALYIVPTLLSVILVYGLFKKSVGVIRMWILISIMETVVLLAITTAGSIYFAVTLEEYYGISIIVLQIIVSLWKMECIVIVNSHYREKMLSGVDPKLMT